MSRRDPEVARERPGQHRPRRQHAGCDRQGRPESLGKAPLSHVAGGPEDGEEAEDDVRRRDLRREEREEKEEAEKSPIAQRASDPGSASSISITGMSDTIG